ncbi:hypothetical protein IJS77_04525, partial [bacterium]|nr:hypothetical protein [bacterium]
LEEIKQKIYALAEEYSKDLDMTPVLDIDLKLKPNELDEKLIGNLEVLEPCGAKNPYPVLAVEGLKFQEQKLIGQKQNHLKFICKDSDNSTFDCVFWNKKTFDIDETSPIDIAFYPRINTFNGNTTLQLDVQDAHYKENKKKFRIYDHRKKKNILPQVCDFVTKNEQKIFIYTNNSLQKNELLKAGFPKTSFVPRENMPHLMFFDYPADETAMKKIVETVNPQNIHFMSNDNSFTSLKELMNKILGMTKYAAHNKDGTFDINAASDAIGTDKRLTEFALEALNEAQAIKINSFDGEVFKLDFLTPVSFEEVMNTQEYDEIKEKWDSINKFREEILNADEEKLLELVQ